MKRLVLMAAFSLAALAPLGAAHAQGPEVSVGLGADLQRKAADYGSEEVDRLRADLQTQVARAIARHRGPVVRADLVIEDAQPNRPTFAQLTRTPGLSLSSIGIGGARVSGTVVFSDGSTRQLRYQWYETSIQDERAAGVWGDADRAFDAVASEVESGRITDAYRGPGPDPHGGHFGQPFHGY